MRTITVLSAIVLALVILPPTATLAQSKDCFGRSATIVGTGGDDVISGTGGDDVIVGLGGDDRIDGRGGADRICGGAGDDRIRGGPGGDRLAGDGGTDLVRGDAGADMIRGNAGPDLLRGGAGDDDMNGGKGQDVVRGGPGDDHLFSPDGDRLYGGHGDDSLHGNGRLDGGPDDDHLRGTRIADTLLGGSGNDVLEGLGGRDRLYGGRGDDHLKGKDGDDRLFGNGGADYLRGGADDDRLDGGRGQDACLQDDGHGRQARCENRKADLAVTALDCPATATVDVPFACDVTITNLGPSSSRYILERVPPSKCPSGSCEVLVGPTRTHYTVTVPDIDPRVGVGEVHHVTVMITITRFPLSEGADGSVRMQVRPLWPPIDGIDPDSANNRTPATIQQP